MVMEIPRRSTLRSPSLRSLRELPPRRPEPPAPEHAVVKWERIGFERYEISVEGTTVGYVEVVGAVFVVLAGCRLDRAVEVLQTLDFTTAVRALTPDA